MQVLSVYAHEEPSSLTAALRHTAEQILTRQGHQVATSDLYGLGWQPVAHKWDFTTLSGEHYNYMFEQQHAAKQSQFSPDILGEMQKLKTAELILLHFPLWWGGVPAILKGWFDRVLAMGFAWDGDHIFDKGFLAGKKALIITTVGEPASYYSASGPQKATVPQLLMPVMHGTLAFCGIKLLSPHIIYGVTTGDQAWAKGQIESFAKRAEGLAYEQNFLNW